MFAASWYEPTIAGFFLVLAGVLPAWITVQRRLGKPNGGGTVVGEIGQVKQEAQKAASAAMAAAAAASTAASAATTASISAQLAASMAESNGTQIGELRRKVTTIEQDVAELQQSPATPQTNQEFST